MYSPSIIVPFMDFEVKIYIVLSNVNPSIDPWNKIKYKASSILLNSNEDKQKWGNDKLQNPLKGVSKDTLNLIHRTSFWNCIKKELWFKISSEILMIAP